MGVSGGKFPNLSEIFSFMNLQSAVNIEDEAGKGSDASHGMPTASRSDLVGRRRHGAVRPMSDFFFSKLEFFSIHPGNEAFDDLAKD